MSRAAHAGVGWTNCVNVSGRDSPGRRPPPLSSTPATGGLPSPVHHCGSHPARRQSYEYFKNYFGKAPKSLVPTTHVLGAAPPPYRIHTQAEVAAAPVDPSQWHDRFDVRACTADAASVSVHVQEGVLQLSEPWVEGGGGNGE